VKYVVAALAGLAGLVLGWVVAAFAFLIIGGMAGVSDFEGKRAMLAFFAVGPIGGVAGLIVGLWLALRSRGRHRPG
jgi:hypothetical protein